MYWGGGVRERNGAREMALQVRTLSAIAKDLSFVPSTHKEGVSQQRELRPAALVHSTSPRRSSGHLRSHTCSSTGAHVCTLVITIINLKIQEIVKYPFNKFSIIRCLNDNIFQILGYASYVTKINLIFCCILFIVNTRNSSYAFPSLYFLLHQCLFQWS